MNGFKEFKEAMKEPALKAALTEFFKEKKPETKEAEILALTEFACAHGYSVSAEDFGVADAMKKELSDEEIENAAGGINMCWDNYYCTFVNNDGITECWDLLF